MELECRIWDICKKQDSSNVRVKNLYLAQVVFGQASRPMGWEHLLVGLLVRELRRELSR